VVLAVVQVEHKLLRQAALEEVAGVEILAVMVVMEILHQLAHHKEIMVEVVILRVENLLLAVAVVQVQLVNHLLIFLAWLQAMAAQEQRLQFQGHL
jgi:hypothetical protein